MEEAQAPSKVVAGSTSMSHTPAPLEERKKAVIIVANGSEEMEIVICSDVLRRAGVDVTIAGVGTERQITCSRELKIEVDAVFNNIKNRDFDAVILPGGKRGTKQLSEDKHVGEFLQRHHSGKRILAAICAGVTVIVAHGVAKDATLTSHPRYQEAILAAEYNCSEDDVTLSEAENVVTSRAPGTAFDFALKLGELLTDEDRMDELRRDLLIKEREGGPEEGDDEQQRLPLEPAENDAVDE